jgi:DNA-3-methyladenine glycosylase II
VARIRFTLRPVAPFRLDLTAWAIRRRPHNLVDIIDDDTYRRVLIIERKPVAIAVRQTEAPTRPEIEVVASGPGATQSNRRAIEAAVIRILGVDIELRDFYRVASADPALAAMAERLRGMKPVRFPTNFEAFTNAVACQLLSLTAGMHIVNRVAAKYGRACETDGGAITSFAEPQALLDADIEELRALGLSRSKARYLVGLAALAADPHDRDFAAIEALDDEAAVIALRKLSGVGRWTAEYVLLRGFGRFNIFPGDDVGGVNRLREWLGIRRAMDYDAVRRRVARWHPWGGFVYFHLLVSALADAGIVSATGL